MMEKGTKYKNHLIVKSGENYRVKDAGGYYLFAELASNIKTAKKWIDAYLIEKNKKRS